MATVALFHSALGLRRGVVGFADQLRAAGHEVHAIDSYGGETFDDMGEGAAKRDALGVPELIHTAQLAVEGLAADIVYAGFSMGTGAVEVLAATRPGARGAVLMSGALGPGVAGIDSWPERVPAGALRRRRSADRRVRNRCARCRGAGRRRELRSPHLSDLGPPLRRPRPSRPSPRVR
jgi:pimeloyl-ACP methyl ester carboxylesterase